jgi:hypothetical protein
MRRLFFSNRVASPGIHATSAILEGVRPCSVVRRTRLAKQIAAKHVLRVRCLLRGLTLEDRAPGRGQRNSVLAKRHTLCSWHVLNKRLTFSHDDNMVHAVGNLLAAEGSLVQR